MLKNLIKRDIKIDNTISIFPPHCEKETIGQEHISCDFTTF